MVVCRVVEDQTHTPVRILECASREQAVLDWTQYMNLALSMFFTGDFVTGYNTQLMGIILVGYNTQRSYPLGPVGYNTQLVGGYHS